MIKTQIALRKGRLTKVNVDNLLDISFVFYFCGKFIATIFSKILGLFDASYLKDIFTIAAIYLPLILYFTVKKVKKYPLDFFGIFLFVISFFSLTLIFHPEYEYWYSRSDYGVWSYVLIPTEAMYAYLFVRLIDNPQRLVRNMKISGWIMYVYFFLEINASLRRGYWSGVGAEGVAKMSYSVSFGYNVLLFAMLFMYEAMMHRKASDIAAAGIGLYMILSYGSRGPMLFIAVFLVLMGLTQYKDSKKKWVIFLVVVPLLLLAFLFYEFILMALMQFLSALNISSRFITKILNGTIADDNNRIEIWQAAIQMIEDNPLGYGAMGSQHVISRYIYAGYPHSFILEVMIDFGVVVGCLILLFLFVHSVKMLFSAENQEWRGVFIVYFCTACQLLISLCYWSSPAFWVSIAVAVNCYLDKKRRHRMKSSASARGVLM